MSWLEKVQKTPRWLQIIIVIIVICLAVTLVLKYGGWFDKVAAVYVSQGDAALSERDYSEAMQKYAYALSLKHLDGKIAYQAYLKRGKILLGKRNYEQAIAELTDASNLRKRRPEAYLLLGQAQQIVGDFDAAVVTLEKGLKYAPENVDMLVELSQAVFRQGKELSRAADLLHQAVTLDDQSQAAYYYLSLVLLENNPEESLAMIAKALDLSGKYTSEVQSAHERILDLKQRMADRQGDNDDEALAYRNILVGWTYASVNEPAAAKRMAETALTISPEYRDAWLLLGWAQVELHDFEDAQASLTEAYNLDSTSGQTQYLFGLAEMGNNELEAAAESFAKALALGYDHRLLRLDYAKLLIDMNKLDEADQQLQQAYKMNRQDLNVALELVWFWGETSDQADKALDLAKQLDREHSSMETQAILSLAYVLSSDSEKAKELAAGVIAQQPNNPLAYYVRGRATSDGADFVKAIDVDFGGTVAEWAYEEIK